MDKHTFEISWASLWRILFFLVLVAIMLLGRRILLGLFLAIVISSGLEFIVNFLERRGLPRTLGVILIFLSGAVLVIMTVYAVIPLAIVDLNEAFLKISKLGGSQAGWSPLLSFRTTQSLGDFINKLSSQFLSGGSPLGAFSDIVGGFVLGVSVLVSSFYLSLTRNGVERFILAVIPADYEADALRVYERSIQRIGWWFRSQLLLSLIVGGVVLITLLVLKVPYAFLLAILTAIFELVPYIGPLISGSAAMIAAFTVSPELALYTVIAFIVIHQIESHVLVPILIGRNVGLHPVIVIVALLIGIEAGGFLGVLISVPAAVVLQELVEHWSDRKKTQRMAVV
jgi:predicted PurR-regulated permease PerM